MKIIIQKFGGTSLATEENRQKAVSIILETKRSGYSPVIVVSAIGRIGDPYATDTLISYATNGNLLLSPRDSDMLMACGEIISGVIMSAMLRKAGMQAFFLSGAQAGIITDNNHKEAKILRIETDRILRNIEEGNAVVVAGFQGVTEKGEITTLGRGGSDTTAAALGVALDAEFVDIYTDVEGVMTADPRIVEDAKLLEVITYNEVCQLAHEGARVIHPRAVEIAMQKNIPLRIRSTFTETPGTMVTSKWSFPGKTIDITSDRLITGITHIPDITRINIDMQRLDNNVPDAQKKIFKALALAGISVDFINVSQDRVLFTVNRPDSLRAVEILDNIGIKPEVLTDCAKIAAVGAGMTGVPGVMSAIVEALADENIKILQSADSYTTIWVLVKKEDMVTSIRALHRRFSPGY